MTTKFKIERATREFYVVIGESGHVAGHISKTGWPRRECPWRLQLHGKMSEDFRTLALAKAEAKTQAYKY